MNYTGHGGADGWAKEKILTLPDIRSYSNLDKMPLFITATCEFSRFDDPLYLSAGEQLFLNDQGGAIALLTTTRLAFAHANVILNRRLYVNLKNTEGNELPRLGDLIRMSKTPSHSNFLNFSLLGDPALRLAFPQHKIETTAVKNNNEKETDTLTALSKITVSGKITNNGVVAENFNGLLYPKIFDKKSTYITRGNDPKSIKQAFRFFDKIIYDGVVTVKNGLFEFSFFVPYNINYEFGKGKISYYALDTVNYIDAVGYNNSIIIGSINTDAENDIYGPDITMYINDTNFEEGDIVDKNSVLHAILKDENGICHTGLGIGRDITIVIDNDNSNQQIVNKFFTPDIDSYTSGKLSLPIENITQGVHTITLKAWDLQNNSSEKTIEFVVNPDENLKVKKVLTYPNPSVNKTMFSFVNNKGGATLEIIINMYDLTGKKVGHLEKTLINTSKVTKTEFSWTNNMYNNSLKKTGIYIYKLIIKDLKGTSQQFRGKLIKVSE
jgi:hypothetical protein